MFQGNVSYGKYIPLKSPATWYFSLALATSTFAIPTRPNGGNHLPAFTDSA
ncbi:hypothetical protein BDR06DRAFT_1011890 [Suillus hirtellus]|nr:hypothetical protein BDR06DRAFT_1011890 [Suillus hirtellus]